jgi:hypothetical protein
MKLSEAMIKAGLAGDQQPVNLNDPAIAPKFYRPADLTPFFEYFPSNGKNLLVDLVGRENTIMEDVVLRLSYKSGKAIVSEVWERRSSGWEKLSWWDTEYPSTVAGCRRAMGALVYRARLLCGKNKSGR